MKKHQIQQRTERRISAALRLGMVAVLLVAQIALVFLLSDVLKQRMALAYSALELLAELAREQQILLFTCQRREGQALEQVQNVTRLAL